MIGSVSRIVLAAALPAWPLAAEAGATAPRDSNPAAIAMFVLFVATTLAITYWAAGRTHTTKDFYAAGGNITGFQNGLAITGDWLSAAALLGIVGLVYSYGFDGLIYGVVAMAGWPLMMYLIAERLRNLGKYTVADVVSLRLSRVPIRTLIASAGLLFVIFYLVAQMVGAGKLIEHLFGLPYHYAVIIVGVLMITYVAFGGMIATTWVQIIKAVLLLSGSTFIAVAVLHRTGYSLDTLYRNAVTEHPNGAAIMAPGGMLTDPISAISLGTTLLFGCVSMPHVLMRFFTVPNAQEARKSVFYAASFIGFFYILTFVIGYGAIALVMNDPRFLDPETKLILGGDNMAAIHLARAVGGDFFLGFISAVAFATIVAVVAGLTISGASAVSHDLYANVFRHGKATEAEVVRVSRIAALCLGLLAVGLGIAFQNQNIAYMIVLPFSICCSVHCPILFLSMFWRRLTTTGAVVGGSLGLLTAIVLIVVGPTIWVEILGNAHAIFPYKYPALFSMTVSFVTIIGVSLLDGSERAGHEVAGFADQFVRSQTGLGAEAATSH